MANLTLMSFAPREDELLLGERLKKLGYRDLVNIAKASPANTIGNNGILILQLRDVSAVKNRVIRQLKSMPQSRVLGLFSETEQNWDYDITGLCHDIAMWPCSESELYYRLQRMAKKAVDHPAGKNPLINLNIVGEAEEFRKVMDKVDRIAKCDAPVYINGETGTGKELVARAVHYSSMRASLPFVALNCGALPDNLIENELFGHARGAFTGAVTEQKGMVTHAEGGTLFLDEIETISPKGQVTLLRFLQDFLYRPIGSSKTLTANIRIITASNESLEQLVEEGRFRQDLYYRLSVMELELPPLRERSEDIELLSKHFLSRYQDKYKWPERHLHPRTLRGMKRYDWPGNVRELENILHRELILSDAPEIRIGKFECLPLERRQNSRERRYRELFANSLHDAKSRVVHEFETEYLCHAMHKAHGNITQAAKLAGKERRTFTKLLEKYSISRNAYRL